MIYQYDQALQLPTVDLYDTQMMAMALNAAKDMYERGEQQIKDFQKAYGDFLTPITADQDYYNKNVTGKVRDAVNSIYARGGDPLRNARDRAEISMLINNMPYGDIAKLRNSAENAKQYLKARAALEASGKYNPDLEERFLGYDINNWDTIKNGAWNRLSPTEMKSLKELTETLYNSRTARDLTAEDLKAAGIPYDKRYQYSGYLYSDLLNTAKGFTPGWNDTVYSQYYRDLARRELQAQGINNPTDRDIEVRLQKDVADANKEWLINPTKKADEFAKMAKQHAYAKELAAIEAENAERIARIKAGSGEGSDGAYSATTNMASDSEGVMLQQLRNYDKNNKMGDVDRITAKEIETTMKFLFDAQLHPDRHSKSQVKYFTEKAERLGLLSGDKDDVDAVVINRKIAAGMDGVADEVIALANKRNSFMDPIGSDREKVNGLNNILHDLSSRGSMTTINNILKEFTTQDEDGGFNLGSSYDRLTGIGAVMEDVLSKAYVDGGGHPQVDKAIKHLKDNGSLSKYRNSWTASIWDARNETDDEWWTGGAPHKVYPTGNVVAGDKYYYIEVANDATDTDESIWFKVERNKVKHGGINPALSSITQRVDDAFLKEYSHTNVIGNQQSEVRKYNK